jgi:hypothetical protein
MDAASILYSAAGDLDLTAGEIKLFGDSLAEVLELLDAGDVAKGRRIIRGWIPVIQARHRGMVTLAQAARDHAAALKGPGNPAQTLEIHDGS